jgi:hypothetical protein
LLRALGLANDIYAQVGLVMLVGLLGKNAVLIVEYAVQRNQAGLSIRDAAIEGAKARFRPILMTSFAFIAGLIPLIRAHGPGAVGNHTIGASALGGMLFGTVFGVAIIPGLYYIFGKLAEGKKLIRDEDFEPVTEGVADAIGEGAAHGHDVGADHAPHADPPGDAPHALAPESEPPAAASPEPPSAPKADTPSAPKADTPSAPKADTPSAPKADTPSAPKADTPSAPKADPPKPSSTTAPAETEAAKTEKN